MGLAVVNGQLYAVGGFDGSTYLKTVELYDRDAASWRHSGNMNYRRLGGGVGVVKMANSEAFPCEGPAKAGVDILEGPSVPPGPPLMASIMSSYLRSGNKQGPSSNASSSN